MAIYKNKASQKLAVFAVDAAGAPKTGDAANISAQISKDGGATAATNDAAPTELDATDAPGIYLFDLLQAETNADLMIVAPKSATGGVVLRPVIVYTEPELRSLAADQAVNVTKINGTAQTAGDVVAVAAAVKVKTDYLPSEAPSTLADVAAAVRDVSNATPAASSIGAVLNAAKALLPAALVGGRMDVSVGAINATTLEGDGVATPWGPA
jgi:hypothetical protein